MGLCVSVDSEPDLLQDFLSSDQGSTQSRRSSSGPPESRAESHVKAWQFELDGRSIEEVALPLGDETWLSNPVLVRTSCYLILHVRFLGRGRSDETHGSSGIAFLKELASRARETCTPRGLATQACEGEVRCSSSAESPELCYSIFTWHGQSADQLLKAHVFGKAAQLDRQIRGGLLAQAPFLDSLRRATVPAGQRSPDQSPSRSKAEEEAIRQGRNKLLASIACGVSPTQAQAKGRRFGRLAQTLERGLAFAATLPAPISNGWMSSRQAPEPQATVTSKSEARPATSSTMPSWYTSATTSTPLAQTTQSTSAPKAGKPVVPKLALGNVGLSLQGAAPEKSMEVDGTAESLSSGRKRPRDDVPAKEAPQTSRPATFAEGAKPTRQVPLLGLGSLTTQTSQAQAPPSSASSSRSSRSSSSAESPRPAAAPAPSTRTACPVPIPSMDRASAPRREPPQPPPTRSDGPMLNLEEINTAHAATEEELMASYDPQNEENNYHLPHHLFKQLQLKHFRQECSEVLPGQLFISSFQVAADEEALKKRQITHIVNVAADICENSFPGQMKYLTYYLKDTNSEDVAPLLYRTLEWMHQAITTGDRVLVHCREGVSRSATIVIAYLMWRLNLSFEAAHEQLRKVRPVCNPNTGFTCQLLLLGKKLANTQGPPPEKPMLFRVAPYHPKEPFLLLAPADWPSAWPALDPRFGWVAQRGLQLVLWVGSQVPKPAAVKEAVAEHLRRLEFFEHCGYSLSMTEEGAEGPLLYQVLGIPAGSSLSSGPKSAYDADFQLMERLATPSESVLSL